MTGTATATGMGNRRRGGALGPRFAGPTREEALALADLFRMLALAYSFPDSDSIDSTRRQIGASNVALSQFRPHARLRKLLQRAAREWRSVALDELRAEYSRLFLGSSLVPLREGGFGDGMRFAGQPVDLADLNGFYLAFGFGPPPTAASPPDHLGVELEFVSLLYLKISYALQRRQNEQVRITRAALAGFLKDHLGRWVGGFEAALAEVGGAPAYLGLAGILSRAVAAECGRLGVEPTPSDRGTISDPVGLDALVCPLAAPVRRREEETPAEIA